MYSFNPHTSSCFGLERDDLILRVIIISRSEFRFDDKIVSVLGYLLSFYLFTVYQRETAVIHLMRFFFCGWSSLKIIVFTASFFIDKKLAGCWFS